MICGLCIICLKQEIILEARYPDEKKHFRKKCTEDFTKEMLNKIEEVFQWLKSML